MQPLPIDAVLPAIREHLHQSSSLLIQAPPGSGKTTRVPPALLDALPGEPREIWVLEPRRLATRLAARRVAFELGERVGQTAGYQVRFEEVAGPRTRLRFMTEGVFTRRLLSDPTLARAGALILDEFHERHLEGDVALALLRRLQQGDRPDLRLIVMSATLEAAPLIRYLGGCPVVRAEGSLFDLDIRYAGYSAEPLGEQVAGAVAALVREGLDGDVLVFLPGAAEIRRAARACQPIAQRADLLIAPLHGDLSPEEQDRAIQPTSRRKVILSTNVAESSVTIEGVRAVIDSGLARVASDSRWTGLPRLQVARVSKASATQRAGRAGRTGPGRVVRLYSAEDFARRPGHDAPEISRRELSHTILELKAMEADDIPWLDAPPPTALVASAALLARLEALDAAGRLTELGRAMARLPLHPRLGRLVVEASRRGELDAGSGIAALLSAGERLAAAPASGRHAPSDLLVLLESDWSHGTRRAYQQIRAAAKRSLAAPSEVPSRSKARTATGSHDTERPHPSHPRFAATSEQALLVSILAAFPDRVARKRRTAPSGEIELALADGGSAVLASSSAVRSEWLVAVDVEERPERGLPVVRLASAIQPDWLLDLFPDRVSERREVEWNRDAERVEVVSALVYQDLTIEETRGGMPDSENAARLLARKAVEAGIERFVERDELEHFLARVSFAAEHAGFNPPGETDVQAALESLAPGLRSFSQLRAAASAGGLLRVLRNRLPAGPRLDDVAPERLRLPGGRYLLIHYAAGQAPWVESRLQDFFGMKETPRIAGGKVPVVVRLLAPNRRPVQITTDLGGFWQRHYPQLRRELSRRYPRHDWPADPSEK